MLLFIYKYEKGPFNNYKNDLSSTYNPYPNISTEITYEESQLSPIIVKGSLCTETVVINSNRIKNQTFLRASEIQNTGNFISSLYFVSSYIQSAPILLGWDRLTILTISHILTI